MPEPARKGLMGLTFGAGSVLLAVPSMIETLTRRRTFARAGCLCWRKCLALRRRREPLKPRRIRVGNHPRSDMTCLFRESSCLQAGEDVKPLINWSVTRFVASTDLPVAYMNSEFAATRRRIVCWW